MTRIQLLGAASAVALLAAGSASATTTPTPNTIVIGGSSLVYGAMTNSTNQGLIDLWNANQQATYTDVTKQWLFFYGDATKSPTAYGKYYSSSSGRGRRAVIFNSIACESTIACDKADINADGRVGGLYRVDMAGSDAIVSSQEYTGWYNAGAAVVINGTASYTTAYGASTAGNLIQVPSVGTAVAVATVNPGITKNNQVNLTDNDLCGIFSGKITDWSGITTPVRGVTGAITVVYRSDDSGTSALFSNHLANVCTTSNSNFTQANLDAAKAVFGQSTFVNMFKGASIPGNFSAQTGNGAVYSTLAAAQNATPVGSAIGYITPDYTKAFPNATALAAGANVLNVAKINGSILSLPNLTKALGAPGNNALNTVPPTTSAAAVARGAWVPLLPTPATGGYPISGYTTFVFPQCFSSADKATAVMGFLTNVWTNASYKASYALNGFAPVPNFASAKWQVALKNSILTNKSGFNYNIQNSTVCTGTVTGR